MPDRSSSDSIRHTLNNLLLGMHHASGARRSGTGPLDVVWRAAAGEVLARHTSVLSLYGGVLRVGLTARPLLSDLEAMEPVLLERLNSSGRVPISALRIELISGTRRPQGRPARDDEPRYEPATTGYSAGGAQLEPAQAPSSTPSAPYVELPTVREELRPVIHRLIERHRERRARHTTSAPDDRYRA